MFKYVCTYPMNIIASFLGRVTPAKMRRFRVNIFLEHREEGAGKTCTTGLNMIERTHSHTIPGRFPRLH